MSREKEKLDERILEIFGELGIMVDRFVGGTELLEELESNYRKITDDMFKSTQAVEEDDNDEFEELRELAKDNHLVLGYQSQGRYACDDEIYTYWYLSKDVENTEEVLDKLSLSLYEQTYEEIASNLDEGEDEDDETQNIENMVEIVSVEKMIEVMENQYGYDEPRELHYIVYY